MKNKEHFEIDFKGHFHNNEERMRSIIEPMSQLRIITKEKSIDHKFWGDDCPQCGEAVYFKINNENKVSAQKKCKYPQGFPPYEFEIDILSGKMVIANDLREFFPIKDDFHVNYVIECARASWAYAKVGLAHGIVGNTCPGVYRIGQDEYAISSYGSTKKEFETQEQEEEYMFKYLGLPEDQQIGSICTDLWWFSICDLKELKSNGFDFEKNKDDIKVVDVTPGRYKFYHQYQLVRNKVFDQPEIYTIIKLIK